MTEAIFPLLSYKIIGLAFKVFNEAGYGFPEKYYQKAFSILLDKEKIPYTKELCIKLRFADMDAGKYFADFAIDDKIIIELKVRPSIGYTNIKQVIGYLKAGNYRLAMLIYFTRTGVKYRRVLNSAIWDKR